MKNPEILNQDLKQQAAASANLVAYEPLNAPEAYNRQVELERVNGFESVSLQPGEAYPLQESGESFGHADNSELGVTQQLVGVIQLGDDKLVGLTRARAGARRGLLIVEMASSNPGSEQDDSRFISDNTKRSNVLGYIEDGQQIQLGRNHQTDVFGDRVSREHAEIQLKDGQIIVKDKGSTNGTEILLPKQTEIPAQPSEQTAATGGLRRLIRARKSQKGAESAAQTGSYDQTTQFIESYLSSGSWSVKSSEVKNIVEKHGQVEKDLADWKYTMTAEEARKLLRQNGGVYEKMYEEPENGNHKEAKYGGRQVISRDSPINEGVYIVPGNQEAIVVDDKLKTGEKIEGYRDAYRSFKTKLKEKIISGQHKDIDEITAHAAFETAYEMLEYDLDFANEARNQYKDQKVNLDYFIGAGKGVCRHQSLLVGYLLEKAIKDKNIAGQVSVERNSIKGKGGHSWARFTASNGQIYIIDPAQRFVGTLDQANKIESTWSYSRPEDLGGTAAMPKVEPKPNNGIIDRVPWET